MAAAFLVEGPRQRHSSSSSARFTPEDEEEGIKLLNVENLTEDLVNGMFCTYEPPTSKSTQHNAARAVRKDPQKYKHRPRVPKSILKWKQKKAKPQDEEQQQHYYNEEETNEHAPPPPAATPGDQARNDTEHANHDNDNDNDNQSYHHPDDKKSVTWRDQQPREDRTDIENKVVGIATKYCGGAFNKGEDIADILSSPTGRAAQSFFTGRSSGGGGTTPASIFKKPKKVFYDDSGNPVPEDEAGEEETTTDSYFPSTTPGERPTPVASGSGSNNNSSNTDPRLRGHQNLFCSNIPFLDTVMEGIGIAGVVAASAAVAAGVPETYVNGAAAAAAATKNTTTTRVVPTAEQEQISEELRRAQESQDEMGIFEPESYDQPEVLSGARKLVRQSTPRHRKKNQRGSGSNNEEDAADHEPRESSSLPTKFSSPARNNNNNNNNNTHKTNNVSSSQRSYANSDITMGNTTIKHFGGNSLFDETTTGESRDSPAGSVRSKSYSSMVEELKEVQKRNLKSPRSNNPNGPADEARSVSGARVGSIKKDYEKNLKSPRSSVVTSSYLNSLKSPKSPRAASAAREETEVFDRRSGAVASLAKKFESPRNNNNFRKSIDPVESRFFDGKVDLLPPTPRRKAQPPASPETPTGYSMVGNELRVHDWNSDNHRHRGSEPTPRHGEPAEEDDNNAMLLSPTSAVTDAEIREAASTILDIDYGRSGATTNHHGLTFAGRRPRSLVKGPETVEDEDEDVFNNKSSKTKNDKNPPAESRQDVATGGDSDKKESKKKSKERFADKLKKSMSVLNLRKKANKKGEEEGEGKGGSQGILNKK